jgi:Flp pilus assembly protein TadG
MKILLSKPLNKSHSFVGDRHQRGQSLVEVAISLTIILTLLAGGFDLGFAFFDYIALRDAAQEGALYGSIHPTDTAGITARIQQSSTKPIKLATDPNLEAPVITTTIKACSGGAITVRLRYNYHLTMPFIGALIGRQTIPLTATVSDTILQPKCP